MFILVWGRFFFFLHFYHLHRHCSRGGGQKYIYIKKSKRCDMYTSHTSTDGHKQESHSVTQKQTFSSMWFNIEAMGVYNVGERRGTHRLLS